MPGPAPMVVTPEAVVLDLPIADAPLRLLARILDVIFTFGTIFGLTVVLEVSGASATLIDVLVGIAGFGAVLVYPIVMESLWRGRTLGKAIVGLRVVRDDGSPVGGREAAVRGALGLVDVWGLAGLGLIFILTTQRRQRLGDMAAGTIVLRRPPGRAISLQLRPPPGCEEFVASLEVGAMTGADYEAIRSFFLLGERDLKPRARARVAATLAASLWHQAPHQVPSWMGPELYLACAGAAYQARNHPRPRPLPPRGWGEVGAGASGPGGWAPPR